MEGNKRVVSDCRKMPEAGCSLTIAGTEEEVLDTAVLHTVSRHGYQDTPETREQIKASFQEEEGMMDGQQQYQQPEQQTQYTGQAAP